MRKLKKTDPPRHSRNNSLNQRNSHPRLTLHPSPPLHTRITTAQFLSNPSSLEKRKPKHIKKKPNKIKKKKQEATRETIQLSGREEWKDHLKLTFRARVSNQKDKQLHNQSLKLLQSQQQSGRKSGPTYTNLINTFPQQIKEPALLNSQQRIYLIDWLSFISAQLLLRRQTLHLAIAFIDAYLDTRNSLPEKVQLLGAAALLLAVKQEERGSEGCLLEVLQRSQLKRQEILSEESSIVLSLNFKLNFNTLPFWCDYFSQKWDTFLSKKIDQAAFRLHPHIVQLRSPQGICYKFYRQLMQLTDTIPMLSSYKQFDISKLALSVLYLVLRVESESSLLNQSSPQLFSKYFTSFQQKASPIFRDQWCFNAIFNDYLTQLCDFEITVIIPTIKWCAQLLGTEFTSDIDPRAYESSNNYEEFLRFATYSPHPRSHCLASFC